MVGCEGSPPAIGGLLKHKATDVEIVPMPWYHHAQWGWVICACKTSHNVIQQVGEHIAPRSLTYWAIGDAALKALQ